MEPLARLAELLDCGSLCCRVSCRRILITRRRHSTGVGRRNLPLTLAAAAVVIIICLVFDNDGIVYTQFM